MELDNVEKSFLYKEITQDDAVTSLELPIIQSSREKPRANHYTTVTVPSLELNLNTTQHQFKTTGMLMLSRMAWCCC